MSRFGKILVSMFSVYAVIGVAQARGPAPAGVPEIDPGFASGAIALLVCGVLMLASRFGKK